MMRALLIRQPFVDMILEGKKTWEIRGSRTSIRGTIGLIPSASGGKVVGVCDVVTYIGPLSQAVFRRNASKAGMKPREAELGYYRNTYAWVLKNPRRLRKPVPYKHPSGAVIWVKLDATVERAIIKQI